MKHAAIALLANLLIITGVGMAVAADAPSASVQVEKFNPAAKLDDYNAIYEIVTVTKIPDTPNLVLHILCIRSIVSPKNTFLWAGRVVAPGVVEGCSPVEIPSGPFAGKLVHEDGQILPPPPPEKAPASPAKAPKMENSESNIKGHPRSLAVTALDAFHEGAG